MRLRRLYLSFIKARKPMRRHLRLIIILTAPLSGIGLAATAQIRQPAAVPQHSRAHAKGTAATPRLIASYEGAGSATNVLKDRDSVIYVYSGTVRRTDKAGNPLADTETVYQIDAAGLSFVPALRYTHKYDALNRDTLLLTSSYTNGAWENLSLTHYNPDVNGRDTLTVMESYNAAGSSFQPSGRFHYSYDALGDTVFSLRERVSGGIWTGYSRFTSTYNAAGAMLSRLTETAAGGVWTGVWRYTNTYNAANLPLTQLVESYGGGVWKGSTRLSYAYDAGGRDTGIAREVYTTAWKNSTRNSYSYDAAGNQSASINWSWDAASSSWTIASRNAYAYNAMNGQTNSSTQIMYGTPPKMINLDSTTYSYDAAGNMVQRLLFRADSAGLWQPSERNTYSFTGTNKPATELDERYNAAGASFENVQRLAYFYNSSDQQTRRYRQEWVGGLWVYANRSYESRYYYEPVNNLGAVSAAGLTGNDLRLYPVPANDRIDLLVHFSKPQQFTASVVDASGRVIMNWNDAGDGLYSRTITTSALADGLYYLSIRDGQSAASLPFVVRH